MDCFEVMSFSLQFFFAVLEKTKLSKADSIWRLFYNEEVITTRRHYLNYGRGNLKTHDWKKGKSDMLSYLRFPNGL